MRIFGKRFLNGKSSRVDNFELFVPSTYIKIITIDKRWALIRAYFRPTVNKRLAQVLFDPTRRDFFDPKGKN